MAFRKNNKKKRDNKKSWIIVGSFFSFLTFSGIATLIAIPSLSNNPFLTKLNFTLGSANSIRDLGTFLAQIGNPSAANNTSTITSQQFDNIINYYNSSNRDFFNIVDLCFSIQDERGNSKNLSEVTSYISVEGVYPFSGNVNVNVSIVLNRGFFVDDNNTLTIRDVQIGVFG